MIIKKVDEFKLSKKVGFPEIALISGYFIFIVPIYFLIMFVKYAQYNTKTSLLEVDINNKLYLSF